MSDNKSLNSQTVHFLATLSNTSYQSVKQLRTNQLLIEIRKPIGDQLAAVEDPQEQEQPSGSSLNEDVHPCLSVFHTQQYNNCLVPAVGHQKGISRGSGILY